MYPETSTTAPVPGNVVEKVSVIQVGKYSFEQVSVRREQK